MLLLKVAALDAAVAAVEGGCWRRRILTGPRPT